jgi:DNA-binding NtrC family response regulator
MSRVGDVGVVRKTDVRINAATIKALAQSVKAGTFREDLFQRLLGVRIFMPPLRVRRVDILPLAEYFAALYARENGIPKPEFSRAARERLLVNPWEGNVRRLKSAVEFGIAFRDERNVISGDAIDRYFQGPEPRSQAPVASGSLREIMERHEAVAVRRALEAHDNNVSKAADALSISRQQLHAKIKKYGIVTRDN